MIQVSGVASTPEGAPVPLQFSPVTVTVGRTAMSGAVRLQPSASPKCHAVDG